MSTKTSIKRIALVAVSALGFGMVSTAPSQAAGEDSAATLISSISLALDTSAPSVGSTVNVAFGAIVTANAADGDDVARFKAYLSAAPAGGFVTVTYEDDYAGITDTEMGTSDTVTDGALVVTSLLNAGDATATTTSGNAGINFTPTKAGTYQLTAWHDADNDGTVDVNEARQTLDIVVSARPGVSAGLSTVYITGEDYAGNDFTPANATSSLYPIYCAKADGGDQCANILVTVKDTNDAAIVGTDGFVYSAQISGAGELGITATDATFTQATGNAQYVQLNATDANNVFNVSVHPNGVAGVGTITIKVTDPAGTTTTLGTRTVNFYGTVATLAPVADAQYYFVAKAATTSGINTGLTSTSDSPAVVLVAKDADGNLVPGLTVTGVVSDPTVLASSAVSIGAVATDAGYDYGGRGYYYATITGASGATSGKSASVTYSTTLANGTKISSSAVPFSIGGSPLTAKMTLDKTSYAPGEKGTLTLTLLDSSGNPASDAARTAVFTATAVSNKAVQGSLPGASVTTEKGVKTYTFYAPVQGGDFTIRATTSTSFLAAGQGVVVEATATVLDENASAAIDAAQEATEAANAATDAANAAAEAADAATAAAQDAQAAVADLAAQVASMVASVRSQLTRLSNLIIKIQKKVRA